MDPVTTLLLKKVEVVSMFCVKQKPAELSWSAKKKKKSKEKKRKKEEEKMQASKQPANQPTKERKKKKKRKKWPRKILFLCGNQLWSFN